MTGKSRRHRYKKFTELLAEDRLKVPLTQAALAKKLKRPQSFVSKFESGERRLDVIEFLEVMQAMGIKPTLFLRELQKRLTSE